MNNFYQQLEVIDFAVVIIYLIIVIGIGYWVSFVKKRSGDGNLFLASNSLKWPSIGLTMWGTNVGPSMLILSAASGFSTGIVAANFSWYAFIFIFLLSTIFAPYYFKEKVSTLPEFIGKRFNSRTRELLAWYSLVTILLSWLGITLYTGGILVSQILGISLILSILILVLIATFFTVAGGLEAIAYTNVFQMVLLIGVSLILVIIGVVEVGGLGVVYDAVPRESWNLFLSNDHPDYPWVAILLGYPVLGIWFWCTDQSMVQSVLGAKNLEQGQLGTNFTGWLKVLDMPLFILPGILCLILYPNIAAPEEAYATLVVGLLPAGMVGLVMAVLIAALISTVDSALNSLSTIFTLDIYVKRFNSSASQKKVISVGRIVVVMGAILGILIALGISKLEGSDLFILMQSILGFIAPPISAVFVVGILWKKANPIAANFTLSVGSAISIAIGLLSLLSIPTKEFWPHPLLLSFFIFITLVILMIVVTLFTQNKKYTSPLLSLIESLKAQGSVSKKIVVLWTLLTVVMIALYVFFN